jgi:hypothetical protein
VYKHLLTQVAFVSRLTSIASVISRTAVKKYEKKLQQSIDDAPEQAAVLHQRQAWWCDAI